MDREEVIKWLKIMKANLNTFPEVSSEKKIEALAEAIRLLKDEQSEKPTGSTTKNDLEDCVSRQEVDRLAYRYLKEATDNHVAFYEDFLDLPSVKIRPRKGEWCKQNDDYFDWYECSECGYGSEGEMQYSSEYDVRTNYCPQCGADMREVEE